LENNDEPHGNAADRLDTIWPHKNIPEVPGEKICL
jgi:hypothetical protein